MDILIKCNKSNITSIVGIKYKKKYFKTFEEDFSVFINH